MADTDFQINNVNRAFPLVDCETDDYAVLSDIRLTINRPHNYRHGRDKTLLVAFGRVTGTATVVIGFDCKDLQNHLLVAHFGEADFSEARLCYVSRNYLLQPRVLLGGELPSGGLDGFAAIGYSADFPASLQQVAYQIEPTCVVVSAEPQFRSGSIRFYNARQTAYTPPAGCEHTQDTFFVGSDYELACGPYRQTVELMGGHQTRLRQIPDLRQLQIETDGTGGEAGYLCGAIPIAGDQSDLDTAPRCDDVLRQINGVQGPNVSLVGLTGVSIEPHPDLNRVVIDLGTKSMILCQDVSSGEAAPVTPIPQNDEGVNCGNDNTPHPSPGDPDDGTGFSIVISPTPTPANADAARSRCLWRADGDNWQLDYYPCLSPDHCNPPDREPRHAAEVLSMPCLPMLLEPEHIIRNGFFLNENNPGAAWDTSSGAEVVESYGGAASTHLPAMRLTAQLGRTSFMLQRSIRPFGEVYLLQFNLYMTSGHIQVSLIDETNDEATATWQKSGEASGTQYAGPYRLSSPSMTIRFDFSASDGSTVAISGIDLVPQ
jgi:hypothetical protein